MHAEKQRSLTVRHPLVRHEGRLDAIPSSQEK